MTLTIKPNAMRLSGVPFTVRVQVNGLASGRSALVTLSSNEPAQIGPPKRVTVDTFHAWFTVTAGQAVQLKAQAVDTSGVEATDILNVEVPA